MVGHQKIAVIGSNGQLGTDVCAALQKCSDVIRINHDDIDICNESECEKLINLKPDYIINTAAFHDVKICETEITQSYNVNAVGPVNLARVSKKINSGFIQISTDYVFDGSKKEPYVETDLPKPLNIYGKTKFLGEILSAYVYEKTCILRVAGLYGKNKCRGKPRLNFVDLMLKLAAESKKITVVNDEFTTPTSTTAVANQISSMIFGNYYGIYHATCEGWCSWYELAEEIFKIKNIKADVTPNSSVQNPEFQKPSYSVLENRNLKLNKINTFPHWKESLSCYLEQ